MERPIKTAPSVALFQTAAARPMKTYRGTPDCLMQSGTEVLAAWIGPRVLTDEKGIKTVYSADIDLAPGDKLQLTAVRVCSEMNRAETKVVSSATVYWTGGQDEVTGPPGNLRRFLSGKTEPGDSHT
jgi:hypothetical protein